MPPPACSNPCLTPPCSNLLGLRTAQTFDLSVASATSCHAAATRVPVCCGVDKATSACDVPRLPKHLPPREPTIRALFIGTAGKLERSPADVKLSRRVFKKYFKGLDPNNIRTHLGRGKVEDLDWLLSPDNIVPGDVLVLLITGHATLEISRGTVTFEFETREGRPVNTFVLQSMINKLPEYCALEIVLGTCHSEAAMIGLHRAWLADSPKLVAASVLPTGLADVHERLPGFYCDVNDPVFARNSSNLPDRGPLPGLNGPTSQLLLDTVAPLTAKATVIAWAAARTNEYAYTEASLPGQKGKYCTMIGAMFRTLISEGRSVTRRTLCARIGEAAEVQYMAREERDRTKTAEEPRRRGPRIQTPLLLSSVNAPGRVLDGYVFQPL